MIDNSTGSIAISVKDAAIASGPIYEDATYKYFGEAAPATGLSDARWSVSRMRKSDSYIQWVNEGKANQLYTDLATVAALTFV